MFDEADRYGMPVIRQNHHSTSLPLKPTGPAWKLYPPRLRQDAHELFIDNDLILRRKHPAIDEFLERNDLWIATEAYERCFGSYDDLIPPGTKINTGLVGVPPGFDLASAIKSRIRRKAWDGHFEEQGLFASIIAGHPHRLIGLEEIWVCHPDVAFRYGQYGEHFIGINSGFTKHWLSYSSPALL